MLHKQFGSSTAHRTDGCQAWVEQSKGIPNRTSDAADFGTVVHGVLEAWNLAQPTPEVVEGMDVTDEHKDMAQAMFAASEAVLDEFEMDQLEAEVFASTHDDTGGTIDLFATDGKVGMVLDYKTGRGQQVAAENNKQILFITAQMMFGESGVADLTGHLEQFVGVIIQPDRAGEIQTKTWRFSIEDVLAFWRQHRKNIELARAGGQTPKAGTHCTFCPAKAVCPATNAMLAQAERMDPDKVEDLVWVLDHIEPIKAVIKAAEELAYSQLDAGVKVPGWKLVAKRAGATTWKDTETALKLLKRLVRGKRDDDGNRLTHLLEVKKLVTPTQAKKILKAHDIDVDALDTETFRPPAQGMTLAREDDPRSAVMSTESINAAFAASL